MAASKLSKFMPSSKFLSSLKSLPDGEQKVKFVDRILKELELIDYFHNIVPEYIHDHHWAKLVRTKSVPERVSMIEYIAITQSREKLDNERKQANIKAFNEMMERERAKFEDGAMGYGAYMYQLMMNPLRNMKHQNQLNGFRQYITRMLGETPKIAFDLQFFPKMTVRDSSKMGAQVEMCLTENTLKFRRPFHFEFLNLDLSNLDNYNVKTPLAGVVNHLEKEHAHQQIVPDVYPDMHYKHGDKNVFYLSKYAKRVFEGPLDPNITIILPATMDYDKDKDSINTVKRYKFTPIYLPIRKYIKWETGGFHMPLPNIVRILQHVANTGDWERAVNENVAYRHKIPIEEQREKLKHHYDANYQKKKEKQEMIRMIENTVK